jgi:SSS family solute:Na+ symporter
VALHSFPSTMAQNFWIAIVAWSACFVVTVFVSLATRSKPDNELTGLVYGLSSLAGDEQEPWYRRPAVLAVIVGVLLVILNLIFW